MIGHGNGNAMGGAIQWRTRYFITMPYNLHRIAIAVGAMKTHGSTMKAHAIAVGSIKTPNHS